MLILIFDVDIISRLSCKKNLTEKISCPRFVFQGPLQIKLVIATVHVQQTNIAFVLTILKVNLTHLIKLVLMNALLSCYKYSVDYFYAYWCLTLKVFPKVLMFVIDD